MSKKSKKLSPVATFFAELGVLKNLPKLGMLITGTKKEGTVAQHVVRAAQIAYVLAELEGADPEKVACMVLFHDNGEIRVGDQHRVGRRYVDISEAELDAFVEQLEELPPKLFKKILQYFRDFKDQETPESIIARDADLLETAITAKEVLETGGSTSIKKWIDNVQAALETDSAKEILEEIINAEDFIGSWWKNLKKGER